MTAFCPHCGYDSALDEPVELGAFRMDGPGSDMLVHGHILHLTPAQRDIVWSLMKAFPYAVRHTVLIERADIGGDDPLNTLKQQVSKLRSALAKRGFDSPFITVWGYGYRWVAA